MQNRCSWPRRTVLVAAWICASSGAAPAADDGEAAFRELYNELVEINTTLSVGSCTAAAEAMAARLRGCRLPGGRHRGARARRSAKGRQPGREARGPRRRPKPVLLLAHIDVVEAKREDWERDPFKLVEEDGFFYARGASDDKAMAAMFTDSLIRFRKEGFKPRRDIILALTCGEETSATHNGVVMAAREPSRAPVDAAFALNEGAGGLLDENGKPVALADPGGREGLPGLHAGDDERGAATARGRSGTTRSTSWRPRSSRLGLYQFPVELNSTSRAPTSSTRRRSSAGQRRRRHSSAVLANPPSEAAARAIWSANPSWNSMLRTTCVATMVEGGPCAERPAAAREGERQLPHPARCDDRGGAGAARAARRGPRRQDHMRSAIVASRRRVPPLTSQVVDPVAARRRADLARRADRADHDDRRNRRPAPQCRGHTDLRSVGHVPRRGRQPRARPQRAHTRKVAARRPALPARGREDLRRRAGLTPGAAGSRRRGRASRPCVRCARCRC